MFKLSRKLLTWTLITGLVVGGVGFLTFGTSFGSYMRSSLGLVKSSVKDSIPIKFEIRRARDLLDELVPEMRKNLRLVAAEEVEIANLAADIKNEREVVARQRGGIVKLREKLREEQISFHIAGREYERTELIDALGTRLDRVTLAEKFLASKEQLLKNRKASLSAAVKNLEKTRLARVELESQIESLEEQYRLMQIQNSGNDFQLDETALSRVQKVIDGLRNRLDVTQKIMESEARFIDTFPPLDDIELDESSVIEQVDAYLGQSAETGERRVVASSEL